jgi:hypothetical protein
MFEKARSRERATYKQTVKPRPAASTFNNAVLAIKSSLAWLHGIEQLSFFIKASTIDLAPWIITLTTSLNSDVLRDQHILKSEISIAVLSA